MEEKRIEELLSEIDTFKWNYDNNLANINGRNYHLLDLELLKYIRNIEQQNKELQEENNNLKHHLNKTCFNNFNDDVELPLRYLTKIGYVSKNKNGDYINNHIDENSEEEKQYDELIKELQDKLNQRDKQTQVELQDRIDKAIKYISNNVELRESFIGTTKLVLKEDAKNVLSILDKKGE